MMYVEGRLQCCGANLDKWDGHELESPDSAAERRCSHPMWRFYDTGIERIPLCAGHYAWWSSIATNGVPEPGDGTSPIWCSPEWYETYEGEDPEAMDRRWASVEERLANEAERTRVIEWLENHDRKLHARSL